MRIFHRVAEQPGGDDASRVRHINHKNGSDLVGYLSHPRIVPLAGIGRSTADDEFRAGFESLGLHCVVVNLSCLFVKAVRHGMVEYAGHIYR